MKWARCSSQQGNKLVYVNCGSAKDSPQGTTIQFFVIRDYHLGVRLVAAKYHVAPFLTAQSKAHLSQGLRAIATRNPRKFAHTATSNVSNRSSGIGRWSSSNTAI